MEFTNFVVISRTLGAQCCNEPIDVKLVKRPYKLILLPSNLAKNDNLNSRFWRWYSQMLFTPYLRSFWIKLINHAKARSILTNISIWIIFEPNLMKYRSSILSSKFLVSLHLHEKMQRKRRPNREQNESPSDVFNFEIQKKCYYAYTKYLTLFWILDSFTWKSRWNCIWWQLQNFFIS